MDETLELEFAESRALSDLLIAVRSLAQWRKRQDQHGLCLCDACHAERRLGLGSLLDAYDRAVFAHRAHDSTVGQ